MTEMLKRPMTIDQLFRTSQKYKHNQNLV